MPIEFTRGNEGLAVGPSGDVYVAALPAPGETMVVGGETVVYPELAVLRFTP